MNPHGGRSVSTTMECVSGDVANFSAEAPTSIHTGFEDRKGIEKPPKHLVTTKFSSVFAESKVPPAYTAGGRLSNGQQDGEELMIAHPN